VRPIARTFAWPDKNGIVALISDLPVVTSVFLDDVFAVQNAVDITKEIMFYVSIVSTLTTRLFAWPNKDGTVALISDIVTLLGNTTVFLDSTFAIENDPDMTKRAMFDASAIASATNRTYTFPDLNGILVLTTGSQTVSGKTLDNTNSITALDTGFTLQDNVDSTKQFRFDLSSIATSVIITATTPVFSSTSTRELVFTTGAQTVTGIKTFDDVAFLIRDPAIPANTAQFDATALSMSQTFTFPNKTGTLALLSDITATAVFLDSAFTIENAVDTSKKAKFNASSITAATTRTFSFPDADGTLALDPGARVGFRVTKSGDQVVGTASTILLPWVVTAANNDYNMGNFVLATGFFTVPVGKTGLYQVSWDLGFLAPPATGAGIGEIYVNGVAYNSVRIINEVVGVPASTSSQWGSMLLPLSAGDTVSYRAFASPAPSWTVSGPAPPFSVVTTWSIEFLRS